MSTAPNVLKISGLHIVRAIRQMPDHATQVPGGIWRGVAPAGASYPHITYNYLTGDDRPSFGGGWSVSNLQTLIKVVDKSSSATKALDVVGWMEEAIFAANGLELVAGGTAHLERIAPLSLPVVENDILFQQEGGIYRTWVESL